MGSQAGSQASFSAAAQSLPPQRVFERSHAELEAVLQGEVSTADGLAELLGRLQGNDDGSQFLPCVSRALELLEGAGPEEAGSGAEGSVKRLVSAILRWALEGMADEGPSAIPKEVSPWATGSGSKRVAYTAAQCRALLANAFFMNIADTTRDLKRINGGLNFEELLRSTKPVAAQKVACLLQYFETALTLEGTEDDAREIVVQRLTWPGDEMDDDLSEFRHWAMEEGSTRSCDSSMCLLHDSGMEQVEDADAFVNFANPNFGYGCFVPSCTQEEIMQVCCPEFSVGMLHVGYMTSKEVVKVYGVRRFSRYTGYLNSFEYAGPWTAKPVVQTILTMDATTHLHFAEDRVLRDIRKAYLCFRECHVISTGRWGCGAFGGQPAHKFAQQLVAASLAGCSLRFSTFGEPNRCDEIMAAVVAARLSAGELLQAVLVASAAVRASVADFTAGLLLEMESRAPAEAGQVEAVAASPLGGEVAQEVDLV